MNRNRVCGLPVSLLYLVPATNWSVQWAEMQRRFPYLPPIEQAIAELCDLAMHGAGIPAAIHRKKDNRIELRLYGANFYLGLYPNQHEDGYVLAYIEPIGPLAHDALADGVLLLQGTYLQLCNRLPDIPRGSTNCLAWIMQEWEALSAQKQQQRSNGQTQEEVSVAHKNYLDTVSSLIDVTYQLEQEKYKISSTILYSSFKSTDKQRSGMHDIYEFRLQKSLQIWQERYILQVAGVPDLRGRIVSLAGTRATIKFETLIDRKRIPPQGNFEIVPNRRIFDLQREAIEMFQDGTARNPHLLHVLVDRLYQPYHPAHQAHKDLNNEQLAAFQHALTVPDLLLVLGPPGTGKTHTITEIIRQHCTFNKKRVLVASRTHKAVDNVLSRLPSTLEVVRLGHEDRVSEDTRQFLLSVKAKTMQQEILGRTAPQASALTSFLDNEEEIKRWRADLARFGGQTEEHEWQWQQIRARKQAAIERISSAFTQELADCKMETEHYEQQLEALEKKMKRWQGAWARHASRAHFFMIGRFFAWRSERCQQYTLETQEIYKETQSGFAHVKQAYAALQVRIQQACWSDSEFRMLEDERQKIEQYLSDVAKSARTLVGLLHGTVERLLAIGQPPSAMNGATVRSYLGWYDQHFSIFRRRALLLRDWRAQLTEERTAQLRSELIRYADVIGATCIGVATVEDLENIDFDLAIVDEAGQICLTDLLVPLARANRAVLVGDHQQLPPFVDKEVLDWLDSLTYQEEEEGYGMDQEAVRNYLTRSAFELLFSDAAQNRRLVRLTRQFRMPQAIADFASHHFYEDQLYTAHPEKLLQAPHHDPLFRSPLAVINTAALEERFEEKRLKSEEWGTAGYVNIVEAALISSLAGWYEQMNVPWVVIVPYRAQAQYIIELLQRRFSDAAMRWEDRVSTVDAFQGSECEKVIYGFTRSNARGDIGFLAEVRRLNVALTRAKEQLIVVGDFSTLARAADPQFRTLIRSLYQHAEQYGEVLSYEVCMQRLASRERKE